MADLRYDPVSGIWVAIAKRRRERPMEFVPLEQVHKQIICPFCAGNEDETPEPVIAYHEDGSILGADDDPAKWVSRIVPNKYPSLIQSGSEVDCGPYQCLCVDGLQELVIPTRRHVSSISDLSDSEFEIGLKGCQDRVAAVREMKNIKHVSLFMNCRSASGASLEHIHLQIMGSPLLSPFLVSRHERNLANLRTKGESILSTLMNWERQEQVRMIRETEHFAMFCPYASRFSFQVWIVPKNMSLPFSGATHFNAELVELCKFYTVRLEELIENSAYNFLVNLAPTEYMQNEHWFVEIFPRLNTMAGYEIGTDIWVNPVPPELAAKRLLG